MDGLLKKAQEGAEKYEPGSLTLQMLEDVIGDRFNKSDELIHWGEKDCKFIYHKTVGFPKDIIIPNRLFKLGYTIHAQSRAKERVNGFMVLPTFVRITPENLIEIHTDDNKYIKKAVVKLRYDNKRDMILVIEVKYDKKKAVVITLYYNKKNHSFDTLDKTKYNKP